MAKKQQPDQPTPYPELGDEFVERVEGRLHSAPADADPTLAAITAVIDSLLDTPPLALLALGDRFTPVSIDWSDPSQPVVTITNDTVTVLRDGEILHEPEGAKDAPGDARAPE